MQTQTLTNDTDIDEMASRIHSELSSVPSLVDIAVTLKKQIETLSDDLEKIKAAFRELAQSNYVEGQDKEVFVGSKGVVEVTDDSRTTIVPVMLKNYLEAKGQGELFMRLINVKVTEVRKGFGDDALLDIGSIEVKPRSKVYIKERK